MKNSHFNNDDSMDNKFSGAADKENIIRAMAGTAHAMRRHLELSMSDLPGGMSAWGIIRHLHHCGPQTQADLARAIGVAGSTLTRRLDQMEDDGLISRTDDPADGRRTIVTLTERATELRQGRREQAAGEISRLTAGASDADLEALARVIKTIRGNLADLHPEGLGGWGTGRRRGGRRGGPGGRRGGPGGRRNGLDGRRGYGHGPEGLV